HLRRAACETRCQVSRLLSLHRTRGPAGEDDAITETVDPDVRIRHNVLEIGANAVEVALDGDVIGGDLLAGAVEEDNVGLADSGTDDVGALGRSHDRICDLRVGNQNVLNVTRQVHNDRLTDAQRQGLRVHLYA